MKEKRDGLDLIVDKKYSRFFDGKYIQYIFLKSILDDASNYKYNDMETMKVFLNYSNAFNSNSIDEDILYKTFKAVEIANGLYEGLLTRCVSWYRPYFIFDTQQKINSFLNDVELLDDISERIDLLKDYNAMNTLSKFYTDNVAHYDLIALSSRLLDINENDKVLNSFAGLSNFVLNNSDIKYCEAYENDEMVCAFSVMIKLICKLDNYIIHGENFYDAEVKEKFDKIFTDGPIGIKTVTDLGVYESDILNIQKSLEFLKTKGTAVVVAPNKVFVHRGKPFVEMRKELKTSGLKSIITLPKNSLNSTALPVNLLVFEKGYKGNILIIDGNEVLTNNFDWDEGHDYIVNTYKKLIPLDKNSVILSPDDLFGDCEDTVNFQRFFNYSDEKKIKYRPMSEIDAEIKEITEKLYHLNK